MSLKDITVSGGETAGPDATVEMVANRMAEKRVGSVVITEADHVVGIVTLDDVVRLLSAELDNLAAVIDERST